jgi:hypothetical protein
MNATDTAQRHVYFFWDYDITDAEICRILRGGSSEEKAWVISRILEHAKWDDIWRYLSVDDIRENLDRLQFRRAEDRELWAHALERWAHCE